MNRLASRVSKPDKAISIDTSVASVVPKPLLLATIFDKNFTL